MTNQSRKIGRIERDQVQCDRKIEARKPDIVFINKKEIVVIITDLAIPGDDRVKDKEFEKLEKYQLLKDEIAKVWRMRNVIRDFKIWDATTSRTRWLIKDWN